MLVPARNGVSDSEPYGFIAVLSGLADEFTDEHVLVLEWLAQAVSLTRSSGNRAQARLRLAELYPEVYEHVGDGEVVNQAADQLHRIHVGLLDLIEQSHEIEPTNLRSQIGDLAQVCLDAQARLADARPTQERWADNRLTARELEIAEMLAEDDSLTNRAIAERLHLSETTIKTHIAHILQKLSLRQRAEIKWVLQRRAN